MFRTSINQLPNASLIIAEVEKVLDSHVFSKTFNSPPIPYARIRKRKESWLTVQQTAITLLGRVKELPDYCFIQSAKELDDIYIVFCQLISQELWDRTLSILKKKRRLIDLVVILSRKSLAYFKASDRAN